MNGTEWVTVFAGPFPRALALQAVLETKGIPTFMPDEMMKVMDPFITGANPLDVELRVPVDARAAAEEVLEAIPPDEQPQLSAAEREAQHIARLSQRVRWCFVFPLLGWAIGAYLGVLYLAAARRQPTPPAGHGVTVALWCIEVLLLVAFLANHDAF